MPPTRREDVVSTVECAYCLADVDAGLPVPAVHDEEVGAELAGQPTGQQLAKSLGAGLAAIGWEVRALDLNAAEGKAVMTLRRSDGRSLHVSTDTHGAVVERWAHEAPNLRPAYKGGKKGIENARFIGRDRVPGFRSALRLAARYLADNPAPGRPALDSGAARNILRPIAGYLGRPRQEQEHEHEHD